MTFQVGDVVEIVKTFNPLNVHLVGSQTVITRVIPPADGESFARYKTANHPQGRRWKGFRPECLRKINPPDWQAPRILETELQ